MEEIKTVELNGKKLTEQEFEIEKKKLQEQNIVLVEVSPNSFKTRMYD